MVQFVNCFEVAAGREDEFLGLWLRVNDHMRTRPGYRSHRLHRAVTPGATYRFVNLAEWDSAEAWRAAHDDEFRALVSSPAWRDFPSTPALYEIAHASPPA